jgi:hypothetical protein
LLNAARRFVPAASNRSLEKTKVGGDAAGWLRAASPPTFVFAREKRAAND